MDIEALGAAALSLATNVVIALAIAVASLWVAGTVRNRIVALGQKHQELDSTLFTFLGSFARYAIVAVAGVFILGRFGVQTTSLAALLGAAGLAIGLALQGTLSHLASGLMLIAIRPIKVGDYIEAGGHAGTVKAIALFNTELATLDNVQIIIPNGSIWSSAIVNYSVYDRRRADLTFGVSYDSDLKKAEKVIRDVLAADPRVHRDPDPLVKVTALSDSSVDFLVRIWCDASDLFVLRADITRAVKDGFEAAGINIPFPTSIVHRIDG